MMLTPLHKTTIVEKDFVIFSRRRSFTKTCALSKGLVKIR